MNAGTAVLIKLGIDALIGLWANHAGKPPGWTPSAQDWADLADEVNNATPEERLRLAKLRAAQFTGPTIVIPETVNEQTR